MAAIAVPAAWGSTPASTREHASGWVGAGARMRGKAQARASLSAARRAPLYPRASYAASASASACSSAIRTTRASVWSVRRGDPSLVERVSLASGGREFRSWRGAGPCAMWRESRSRLSAGTLSLARRCSACSQSIATSYLLETTDVAQRVKGSSGPGISYRTLGRAERPRRPADTSVTLIGTLERDGREPGVPCSSF
jgi:hypothetical protein